MVVGEVPMMASLALQPLNLGSEMCSVPLLLQGSPPPPVYPYTPYTPPQTPPSPASPPLVHAMTFMPWPTIPTIPYHQFPVFSFKPGGCTPPMTPPGVCTPPMPPPGVCTPPMPPPGISPCQPKKCTPGLCCLQLQNFKYRFPTNIVYPWKQLYGMEQVWRSEFGKLFQMYTRTNYDLWSLIPVSGRPDGGVFYEDVDSAKVRFCCEACGHGWTSMKGRVAFWFFLNYATNEGIVCLKLYGQQCDRCKRGVYEQPMWYPEEVTKVMVNIYNKVGCIYYGFNEVPYQKTRRAGKPRTPHNNNLCQACKDGVCAERR